MKSKKVVVYDLLVTLCKTNASLNDLLREANDAMLNGDDDKEALLLGGAKLMREIVDNTIQKILNEVSDDAN